MPHDSYIEPLLRPSFSLIGKFSRVNKARGIGSGSAASHEMKQEITRFIMIYVPVSPHHGRRTSRPNKKSSLKTWRSPSSTSKCCVTASRTDKDEEVNQGEDEGRTEMAKVTVPLPIFPLMASERQMKLSAPVSVQISVSAYCGL